MDVETEIQRGMGPVFSHMSSPELELELQPGPVPPLHFSVLHLISHLENNTGGFALPLSQDRQD